MQLQRNTLLLSLSWYHLFFLGLVASAVIWGVMLTSEKHTQRYRELITAHQQKAEESSQQLQQVRKGIEREIHLGTKIMRLKADSGHLFLKQMGLGSAVVEEMQEVEIVIYDTAIPKGQRRRFKAKKAHFDYQERVVTAFQVQANTYPAEGNFVTITSTLGGYSDQVTFTFKENGLKINTGKVKMKLGGRL